MNNSEIEQFSLTIDQLKIQTTNNDRDYASLKHTFENLLIGINDVLSFNYQYEQSGSTYNAETYQKMFDCKQQKEAKLQKFSNDFKLLRMEFVNRFEHVINSGDYVLNVVINNYLRSWRQNQILVGNGLQPMNPNLLNKIQMWCESLAQIFWNTRKQLKMVPMYSEQLDESEHIVPNMINEFSAKVTNLVQVLITKTVIVEQQPPQVLKKNTRFGTTLRLLIGNALSIKMTNPTVTVSIVSEPQAQLSQQLQCTTNLNSGELINCSGSFEFNETTSKLIATFRTMQLKKISRSEKKGAENVTDEKFALLFQSHFTVGDGNLIVYISALSMPIVVIVHGSQEPQSQATILWDNAFSEFNRRPFDVTPITNWTSLADALKMKFCETSSPPQVAPNVDIFTADMLQSLCRKALRQNDGDITWAQFCKDHLPDRTFTFWEWFYAAMRLIREHLFDLWNKNYIFGFIEKHSAEQLLLEFGTPGTFLLRFSDSELGGLTIAVLKVDENNSKYVLHIQPLNSKKLAFHSLPDRISDLVELETLYPNINKNDAFGKSTATPLSTLPSGYVPMDVHASLPKSSVSENVESMNMVGLNIAGPSNSDGRVGPEISFESISNNIQLPNFNIFQSEYDGIIMEHDWLDY